MAGVKGAKLAARTLVGAPRKHYCPEHDVECKPTMLMPKRRMIYTCASGCSLSKKDTILK